MRVMRSYCFAIPVLVLSATGAGARCVNVRLGFGESIAVRAGAGPWHGENARPHAEV